MADKCTKNDIVDAIYEKTGFERRDVKTIFELVLDEVKGALIAGKTLELRHFGTFAIRWRKGRSRARNPRTGEAVTSTAHGVAVFKPGQDIKRGVWNLPSAASVPPEGALPQDVKSAPPPAAPADEKPDKA